MRLIFLLFSMLGLASANAQQTYLINWDEVGAESTNHLGELIQIDSSNPPGNETDVANYLQAVLADTLSVRAMPMTWRTFASLRWPTSGASRTWT